MPLEDFLSKPRCAGESHPFSPAEREAMQCKACGNLPEGYTNRGNTESFQTDQDMVMMCEKCAVIHLYYAGELRMANEAEVRSLMKSRCWPAMQRDQRTIRLG